MTLRSGKQVANNNENIPICNYVPTLIAHEKKKNINIAHSVQLVFIINNCVNLMGDTDITIYSNSYLIKTVKNKLV